MFELCSIRSLLPSDLPMVLVWRNHPDVRRFMFTRHEISSEEHRNWFENAINDSTRHLCIVEDASNPIGYVQFSNISAGGVGSWGFYLRPDVPKGSGRKLGTTALNHAFSTLRLHKVCGEAIDSNQASIVFHKRLGFTQEGVLRDQKCIDGKYYALIVFGLLSHEWLTEKNHYEKTNSEY